MPRCILLVQASIYSFQWYERRGSDRRVMDADAPTSTCTIRDLPVSVCERSSWRIMTVEW